MGEPKITRRKITDYQPNPQNLNNGTERGLRVIENSLRGNGVGRSLVASADDVLIAGNHTQEGLLNVGIENVLEIETDGDTVIVHKRRDLKITDKKAITLGISDNRASMVGLDFDELRLAETLQELANEDKELLATAGYYDYELGTLLQSLGDDVLTSTDSDESELPLTRYDVPDALFASDNEYDIPTLDAKLQAQTLDLPVVGYGSIALQSKGITTYHFYTDDRRFEPLWNDPSPVVNSGCRAIIEPNFSCYPTTPRALVLWSVYRKRWLARYYQSFGIRVIVDLNVAPNHTEDNMLGVPKGWKSYACAARADDSELIHERYQIAREHACTDDVLFVVYGTGKLTKKLCQDNGWVFVQEFGKAQWIKNNGE